MAFCTRCGNNIGALNFCGQCGAPSGGSQLVPGVAGTQTVPWERYAILAVSVLLVIVVGYLTLHDDGKRRQGQLTACKSNLKNLGTAMEMYSTDNGGRFPTSIFALTPNYLKVIPTCPSTGTRTYADGFTSTSDPDSYVVVCAGTNHSAVNQGACYPQYTSTQGLISQ